MKEVLYEVRNTEARITLNRPERRNAFTPPMVDAIGDALEKARDDENVRVVVITGNGPAFCSGADLHAARGASAMEKRRRTESLYWRLDHLHRDLGKPTIAALNGPARAGGCTLAFMCDMIIATKTASLGLPEVDRGILPAYHLVHLPRTIGKAKAFAFAMSGEPMPAEEAERVGLFTSIVDTQEELEQAVQRYVAMFSAKSPTVLKVGKEVFYRCMDIEFSKAIRVAGDGVALMVSSGVTDVGLDAFAERRPPEWERNVAQAGVRKK